MKIETGNSVGSIAEQIVTVIVKVEAGASVRSCCDKPGGPTRNEFRRAIARDPAQRRRYDAAIAKWSAPHARSLIHFDEIERRIRAGEILAEIFNTDLPSFPDSHSFWKFLKASPEHAERYRAAFRHRETSPKARGAQPRFTDAELRQAVDALAATSTRYVSITRAAPHTPHTRTLMEARARNAELCATIENALLSRIVRLKIKDGPMFRPLTPGLILPRRKQVVRVYEQHVLLRSLRQNDVYAMVDAAVPKYLNPYDRDDIIAQTMLEVIEDNLALDSEMVASVATEVMSEHFGKFSRFERRTKSLDAPLFSDSTTTLIDTLSHGWD